MYQDEITMTLDYESYLSPFSWRYGSQAMRQLWSEAHKRRTWRFLWVTLADVQAEFELLRPGRPLTCAYIWIR